MYILLNISNQFAICVGLHVKRQSGTCDFNAIRYINADFKLNFDLRVVYFLRQLSREDKEVQMKQRTLDKDAYSTPIHIL